MADNDWINDGWIDSGWIGFAPATSGIVLNSVRVISEVLLDSVGVGPALECIAEVSPEAP